MRHRLGTGCCDSADPAGRAEVCPPNPPPTPSRAWRPRAQHWSRPGLHKTTALLLRVVSEGAKVLRLGAVDVADARVRTGHETDSQFRDRQSVPLSHDRHVSSRPLTTPLFPRESGGPAPSIWTLPALSCRKDAKFGETTWELSCWTDGNAIVLIDCADLRVTGNQPSAPSRRRARARGREWGRDNGAAETSGAPPGAYPRVQGRDAAARDCAPVLAEGELTCSSWPTARLREDDTYGSVSRQGGQKGSRVICNPAHRKHPLARTRPDPPRLARTR